MLRKVPKFRTDKEAVSFLDQDLSDLDFAQFQPATFEFGQKDTQLNLRVPKPLLDAVKERARAKGVPYTRYIRQLMERDVVIADVVSSSKTAPRR